MTRELEVRARDFPGELVSIYLGGGTPSLWRPDCIAAAIAAVIDRYGNRPREITIEANPTDVTDANLAAWRAAGIDRVSIGVQSLEAGALVTLGRDHRFGDGRAAVARALAAGLTTSADFILGTPGSSSAVETLGADHLSVYELTIEERTSFGQRVRDGRLVPLDEDTLTELYVRTHAQLEAAGYEHYEISSYARPGKRAVHNSLYWRGDAYLGLGVGAASLQHVPGGGAIRATNPRRWTAYRGDPGAPADRSEVPAQEMAVDRLWLGMRTSDGVSEEELPTSLVDEWGVSGLAVRVGGRICPTLRGFLMADRIAASIVQRCGDLVSSSMRP